MAVFVPFNAVGTSLQLEPHERRRKIKNTWRKILGLALVIALLSTSVTVFATENTSCEIDLTNAKAQSFEVQWQGQPATITVGEAVRVGPQPRRVYDLTEGVGTWTREIYANFLSVVNVSYVVNYTINANYRVTINDIYAFQSWGIGFTPSFSESKIVRANETSSSAAGCYAIWDISAGDSGQASLLLKAEFKDRKLTVSIWLNMEYYQAMALLTTAIGGLAKAVLELLLMFYLLRIARWYVRKNNIPWRLGKKKESPGADKGE